jgi:hypothetical protein
MAGITRQRLKELVKEVMVEESEYQAFFQKALDKAGKSIPSMSDEEKKAFFDKIDSAWNGKGEKNEALVGGQKELDVDGDGEIEGSDLADLRAGKKADESVNEGVSSADMDKIKGAVEAANSFMSVGSELKKLGMKYTFATEPLPIYIIQPTPNNKVAIVNKKYVTKPDFVVGDIAVGIMEGKINEISFIDGLTDVMKGQTSHIEGTKLSKGMAEHIINWMNTSPYGKKYNPWVKKNSIAKILPIAFNWGLERGLPANLKSEFVALKAKHGKSEKAESVKK